MCCSELINFKSPKFESTQKLRICLNVIGVKKKCVSCRHNGSFLTALIVTNWLNSVSQYPNNQMWITSWKVYFYFFICTLGWSVVGQFASFNAVLFVVDGFLNTNQSFKMWISQRKGYFVWELIFSKCSDFDEHFCAPPFFG